MSESETRQDGGGLMLDGARRVVDDARSVLPPGKRNVASKLLAQAAGAAMTISILMSSGCDFHLPPFFKPTPTPQGQPVQPESQSQNKPMIALASPTPDKKPDKIPTPQEELFDRRVGSLVFQLDSQQRPVSYINPEGKRIFFDKKELAAVQALARKTGEIEIVETLDATATAPPRPESPAEHPVLKDLPKDVLTLEQLRSRGVEVVQADTTQLYIRKSAFDPGGPLADYQPGGTAKIKIALLGVPFISDAFLDDPRYAEARAAHSPKGLLNDMLGSKKPYTKIDPETERQNQLANANTNLDLMRKQKISASTEEKQGFDFAILATKQKIISITNETTDELREEIAMKDSGSSSERGFTTTVPDGKGQKIYIGLAVGRRAIPPKQEATIIVDPSGRYMIQESTSRLGQGATPQADESYPDPSTFFKNPNANPQKPGSYLYGGFSPGFSLEHELKHDELIWGAYRKDNKPNYSEYDTDVAAANQLERAWKKWVTSGYKDDTGYPFVFSLPEGGYILTNNPVSEPTPQDQ